MSNGYDTPAGESGRVLIVSGDERLQAIIEASLEPLGYKLERALDGPTGLQRALDVDFHAVILELELPGMTGLEVLKSLRVRSNVPVLLVTPPDAETDRIVGLELGADDSISRASSTRELVARVTALIRRAFREGRNRKSDIALPFAVADLRVDIATRTAFLSDRQLDLTPTEFELLVQLATRRGRVVTRDRLSELLSDRDYDAVVDRAIDVHVAALRRELTDDPRNPRFLRTVRGAGYMFLDGVPEKD